jgi:hypothetical protein
VTSTGHESLNRGLWGRLRFGRQEDVPAMTYLSHASVSAGRTTNDFTLSWASHMLQTTGRGPTISLGLLCNLSRMMLALLFPFPRLLGHNLLIVVGLILHSGTTGGCILLLVILPEKRLISGQPYEEPPWHVGTEHRRESQTNL